MLRSFRRGSGRESAIDLMFLAPTLALLAVFLFYPLAYGLVLSVHDTRGFDLTRFVGLENYARALFGDAVFHQSLLNTVVFTGAAVVLLTGLGLLLAVLVADVRRGRTFFRVAFFAPFVLASVAVGAVWKFLYAPYFGVRACRGSALGVDTLTTAPLADPHTALWAILVAFLWRFAGFNMVVYLAAIENLPASTTSTRCWKVQAGSQTFRRITFPLLWPQTFVLVLLTTLGTLRIFDMIWVMTEGGPVARHRHGRDGYLLDGVPVPAGRLCPGDGDDPARRDPGTHSRRVPSPRPSRRRRSARETSAAVPALDRGPRRASRSSGCTRSSGRWRTRCDRAPTSIALRSTCPCHRRSAISAQPGSAASSASRCSTPPT